MTTCERPPHSAGVSLVGWPVVVGPRSGVGEFDPRQPRQHKTDEPTRQLLQSHDKDWVPGQVGRASGGVHDHHAREETADAPGAGGVRNGRQALPRAVHRGRARRRARGRRDQVDVLAAGVDAVTITTPPETRRALVLAAVAAGVHVIADKPFAPTAAGGREMDRAARNAGVALNVFHNRRWASA